VQQAERSFPWLAIFAAALVFGGLSGIAHSADDESAAQDVAAGESRTGRLIVRVAGLQSSEGSLRFVMFATEEDFLKTAFRAGIVDIQAEQGSWTVEDLPFGDYAVLVHHDIDRDGVMARHWYGKPKGPTGTSNDAPARFGPPKFKKARFLFESPEQTLTITVR
jgi:uncharacterized protein (DUF2141 family)